MSLNTFINYFTVKLFNICVSTEEVVNRRIYLQEQYKHEGRCHGLPGNNGLISVWKFEE